MHGFALGGFLVFFPIFIIIHRFDVDIRYMGGLRISWYLSLLNFI